MSEPSMTAALERAVPSEHERPSVPGYELGPLIGRGGMGDVYRARDLDMNRDVAVKLLQARYPVDSLTAARFLSEARVTGQLQHPGIPAIYRVAKLPDGRPYLAMKLIKGSTLDELLKSNATLNHLAIIEAVAQALGYAHSHGVIHRDIKPANIMIGPFGEVQLMDWGLSKVLSETSLPQGSPEDPEATTAATIIRNTPDSDHTQAGNILGTPAYMAPEQAAGETDRVGPATDVFGLGALWCKLLTGHAPFSGHDAENVRRNALRGKTDEAMARLDSSLAEPGVIALVKQCLSFEPADRPADANIVAAQVAALRIAAEQRARQAELAQARAEVETHEQQKRRRLWSVLAATLLVGVVASSLLAWWANTARVAEVEARQQAQAETQAKEKERQRAEEQQALATAVKNFLQFDLLQLADPSKQSEDAAGGNKMDPELKVRDLVIRASKLLDGRFSDQPLLEGELRLTLVKTLLAMGRPDLALGQNERLRTLYTEQLGIDHPTTLTSMSYLANTYTDLGRIAEAFQLHAETLARRKQQLGNNHPETLMSMNNLANRYSDLGRHEEALTMHEETLKLRRDTLGLDHRETLESMSNLANTYGDLGRHLEALKLREETLKLKQHKLGREHPDTLMSMHNLTVSYGALGRHAEALPIREETLRLRQKNLGVDHPYTLTSMNNLANTYTKLGRLSEALKLREENVKLRKHKFGLSHPDTLNCMNNLANSYSDLNRDVEAIEVYRQAIAEREKLAQAHPEDHENLAQLGALHNNTGSSLRDIKKLDESLLEFATAKGYLQRVLVAQPKASVARMYLSETHWNRAKAFEKMHRYTEAESDWDTAEKLSRAADLTDIREERAKCLTQRKKH